MCYSSSQNIVTLAGNRNMLNIYDVMNAAQHTYYKVSLKLNVGINSCLIYSYRITSS